MSEYGAVPFALMIVIVIYIVVGEYFKSIHVCMHSWLLSSI